MFNMFFNMKNKEKDKNKKKEYSYFSAQEYGCTSCK